MYAPNAEQKYPISQVFPVTISTGAPPSLVIMGMGRLCGKILTGQVDIKDRYVDKNVKIPVREKVINR